ncbi:MAG TPA: hypothetical protein VJH37_01935 [Candidatus Nanoarchaeia archaeon]|nr:hypothetical protein [Candidatus Nanoarchaeia archaeon]
MGKYRRCLTCMSPVMKSARSNPYMCRECERETGRDIVVPIYHRRFEG